jgi:tetratricopeptide (TPR) repeat protein
LRKYYVYRGLANLELDNIDQAVTDLETAHQVDEKSYEINLGLARAYFIQEKFGSAFLQVEAVKTLAKTDEQKALGLYWHALIQEKREQPKDAVKDWQALLAMDKKAMTAEMRETAETHLKSMATPTVTPKPVKKTPTPAPTSTPRGGTGTPTPTPTRTPTPTPTRTPTPTPTRMP